MPLHSALLSLSSLLLLPLAALAQPPAPARPVISLEPEAVVASGCTPRGRVVWFGVAREISEHAATIVRREEILTDDDGDGTVRFELGREVPFQSIWVAVDLENGAWTAATPEGFPLREFSLPGRGAVRGQGRPDWIETTRGYVHLLVVRPGQGAWGFRAGDGGAGDDDGESNGVLAASLARLRGVGASPAAPERFDPRDLWIVVDPTRMEISVRQIAEGAP
ncbi:MAG TPA: hypothetical protein VE685_18045 [Thermoanaerobaculia bacterium]|nr:hypothetical protein [Thermoanaerobaculia bacterium]